MAQREIAAPLLFFLLAPPSSSASSRASRSLWPAHSGALALQAPRLTTPAPRGDRRVCPGLERRVVRCLERRRSARFRWPFFPFILFARAEALLFACDWLFFSSTFSFFFLLSLLFRVVALCPPCASKAETSLLAEHTRAEKKKRRTKKKRGRASEKEGRERKRKNQLRSLRRGLEILGSLRNMC